MSSAPVILVDDEEDVRLATQQALELEAFDVIPFARAERALERVGREFPGVVVSDIRMPRMDGLALLEAVHEVDPNLPVILMTGHGDVPLAVEAMRKGAFEFIEKPFATSDMMKAVRRAVAMRQLALENRDMRRQIENRDPVEAMLIGRAPAMVELRQKIRAVAASDIDTLILGETGTGKDLVARAIHEQSDRRDKPFAVLNLASLPPATIESELFGHEAGAFPGAHRARFGKFEHARGGTLLLDEIGAAPLDLQSKLLRVIEDRAVVRVGSNERIDLDLRFIASSNRDLDAMVAGGTFRQDLLFRLAVVTLSLPPLADRVEDVPRLFQHLVTQSATRYRRAAPTIEPDFLMDIAQRDWPGNVRELRNAADRFVLGLESSAAASPDLPLADLVERFEKGAVAAALARHQGDLKATYESLGISRKTLYEKMQRHGLKREDFAPG
ncbi:sigma-54-dependent Fis family transcriptional regulator [Rhodobacteraceae bacterium NNCM2]|nr:sigma-54-dependent Fis family transcriptional regulator [Coraliihabitans acroporae]